eukprot:UN01463
MSAKGKGKGKTRAMKKRRISKAQRAGLVFNVGRVLRQMREGEYTPRVSPLAAVVLSATLEYMVAELIEVSGEVAKDMKKKTNQTSSHNACC